MFCTSVRPDSLQDARSPVHADVALLIHISLKEATIVDRTVQQVQAEHLGLDK